MAETIVIAGSVAQKPGQGGHTWVFLQYLLGFRRLGWDVLFLDRLEPEMCRDALAQPCALDRSENLRDFQEVIEPSGLREAFALGAGRGWLRLSRTKVLGRVRASAFRLNVMGFLND